MTSKSKLVSAIVVVSLVAMVSAVYQVRRGGFEFSYFPAGISALGSSVQAPTYLPEGNDNKVSIRSPADILFFHAMYWLAAVFACFMAYMLFGNRPKKTSDSSGHHPASRKRKIWVAGSNCGGFGSIGMPNDAHEIEIDDDH